MIDPSTFATTAIFLYVAHHVGDYWVQRDVDAQHKGDAGILGRLHCLSHVLTYMATQTFFLAIMVWTMDIHFHWWAQLAGLAVSGITHYMADRREHGLMFKLARAIPGKSDFLKLGVPRPYRIFAQSTTHDEPRGPIPLDNPSLGTGAWALDQAWHIFFGVFVAGLVASL